MRNLNAQLVVENIVEYIHQHRYYMSILTRKFQIPTFLLNHEI